MAAQLKDGDRYTGTLSVKKRVFEKILKDCENPQPPSNELRQYVAEGRRLIKR